MAMKRCPVCGERYSDTYKECPFCEEEEYWGEEQDGSSRTTYRESSRGGRSAYGIVTPVLIVLIVLMALLLVYLLYGDKLGGKNEPPDDSGKVDVAAPPVSGTEPSEPDVSGEPGTDGPGTDEPEAPDTMPEGGGEDGESGGMSYASAAALPGGLTLSSTDFTQPVSKGDVKLRVSGGTGTYTWISENPAIATVASDGTVTPVARGVTNVLVTDGTKKAVCIVRVTGGSAPSGTTTTTTPAPTTPSTTTPSSGGGSLKAGSAVVVNGGNGVRVRSGPGTNYDILASVPNGGSVQIVRSAGTDDWYEITFSNVNGATTTGYMKGEFLANS